MASWDRKPDLPEKKFSMGLHVEEEWKKTKRKDTYGNLSGFTFRSKNGHLFVNLGVPKLINKAEVDADPENVEPHYRFHMEVSHAAHYNERQRKLGVSFNDRVFFAEGDFVSRVDDPSWRFIRQKVEELVEVYNIAVMRVGRVFNIPDKLLGDRDIPGGYMLLAAKVGINSRKQGAKWNEYIYPDAYTDPMADWHYDIHYLIKGTTDGFRNPKQNKSGGPYGWGRHHINVPEDQLGDEVNDKTAGETLREAGEKLHAALIEHTDRLRDMALKAADESTALKERRQLARELDSILNGSYRGHRQDFKTIGAPEEPVRTVTEAIKGLLTLLPTPEDEERDFNYRY